MTKKHFEAIARILNITVRNESERTLRNMVALNMADYFASENPRFKRDEFLTACGVV